MIIRYKKLDKKAKNPYKKYDVDAGFDLTAIWKEENDKFVVYGTGLAFEIPEGYVGLLFPRSSVTNKDLMLKNSVGVVDASYRGEIMFRFFGTKKTKYGSGKNEYNDYGENTYELGDRCGQIVFVEIPKVQLLEAAELSETERGTAGYGSSGNK
jgi:dUTP pyrophosphatase